MGTTRTFKYRVEYRDQGGLHKAGWNSACYGRPSHENIEKWRQHMNASYGPGGSNFATAKAIGYVPHISYCQIVEQSLGQVVAWAEMPMFEAA